MEEPHYVKFILATTELHKVPATITSRCSDLISRRITADDISKRLHIAEQEVTLDEKASVMIATLQMAVCVMPYRLWTSVQHFRQNY